MIERTIFREEHHEIFRQTVRRFPSTAKIVLFHAQWEEDGIVPRELWLLLRRRRPVCCVGRSPRITRSGSDYLPLDVVVFEESLARRC